jgi:hypothetical protein
VQRLGSKSALGDMVGTWVGRAAPTLVTPAQLHAVLQACGDAGADADGEVLHMLERLGKVRCCHKHMPLNAWHRLLWGINTPALTGVILHKSQQHVTGTHACTSSIIAASKGAVDLLPATGCTGTASPCQPLPLASCPQPNITTPAPAACRLRPP